MKKILVFFQLVTLGAAAQTVVPMKFDPGEGSAGAGYVKLSVKDVKSLLQNGKRNLKTMMLSINQKNDEQ